MDSKRADGEGQKDRFRAASPGGRGCGGGGCLDFGPRGISSEAFATVRRTPFEPSQRSLRSRTRDCKAIDPPASVSEGTDGDLTEGGQVAFQNDEGGFGI